VALAAGVRYVLSDPWQGTWMLGAQLRSPSLRVHTQGSLLFSRGNADPAGAPGEVAHYTRITDDPQHPVESSSAEGVNLRAGLAYTRHRSFTWR